jgi:spore coat polysaccharide biosynthesis protein SpsF (cytidylyltransferase family)
VNLFFGSITNKEMKKTVAIIPARMESSRFPGKPLAKICGPSMIEHGLSVDTEADRRDAEKIMKQDSLFGRIFG